MVAVRPGVGARAAAVLILIGEGGQGPEILFVERPATMRTHAAQIAFPGGAADPDDADLADTALREAYEETGVDRDGIEVLGLLPPAHVEVSGFDVSGSSPGGERRARCSPSIRARWRRCWWSRSPAWWTPGTGSWCITRRAMSARRSRSMII